MLSVSNSLLLLFLKPTAFRPLPSLFTRAALAKVTGFLNHQFSALLSLYPSAACNMVGHSLSWRAYFTWFPWLPTPPVFLLSHSSVFSVPFVDSSSSFWSQRVGVISAFFSSFLSAYVPLTTSSCFMVLRIDNFQIYICSLISLLYSRLMHPAAYCISPLRSQTHCPWSLSSAGFPVPGWWPPSSPASGSLGLPSLSCATSNLSANPLVLPSAYI